MFVLRYILPILLLTAISCNKEHQPTNLEKANDLIQGQYYCVSMYYLGDPIDLDNDGICNNDLKAEFSSFYAAKKAFEKGNVSRVFPARGYNDETTFSLTIPAQTVIYYKLEDIYEASLSGAANFRLSFSYTVQNDGSISFKARNDIEQHGRDDWEDERRFQNIDVVYTNADCVESFNKGTLVVRINGTYYDFNTKRLVTGPVKLTYERLSSAMY